ncbi:unnamed protein product [Discula destructiva]
MDREPTYTVFIRLPFPRGDFVDPPPVEWTAAKDEELWKIFSGVAKPATIDWDELAARFGAPFDFLTQQVAYLHHRHDSQVRATLRMAPATARIAAVQSPMPGSESSTPLIRPASGQGQPGRPRAPSQLSIRKDSPAIRNHASLPNTPRVGTAPNSAFGSTPRPQPSRGPSGGTQAQGSGPGSATGSVRLRTGMQSGRQRFSMLNDASPSTPVALAGSTGPASPSSDDSSDESSAPAQSRVIRRPPHFQQSTAHNRDGAESFLSGTEDEEPQAAFVPYQSKPASENEDGSEGASARFSDPSATLRGDPRNFAANAARRLQNVTGETHIQGKGKGKEKERVLHRSGMSDSSGSSASKRPTGDRRHPANPLSPRRTAELKGKGLSREGSDGAPSMGSSFSDLDDASVTQSALEEAVASKMQGGGLGSTISMFRSRYLPQ